MPFAISVSSLVEVSGMKRIFFRTLFGSYGNESLTGSTVDIMRKVLDGKLSDVKTASLLTFLKYHRSPYIYGKVIDVLRDKLEGIDLLVPDSIELGYSYRLKKDTPYFMIASAIVLSLLPRSDIKAVFHGDNLSKGSTKDIFDHLGITVLTNKDSESMLKNLNIGFFNRSLFLPSLSDLNYLREELNIDDVFSYAEKFVSPVGSLYHITGADITDIDFYLDLLKNRYERFGIIAGKRGFPDIVGSSELVLFSKDRLKRFKIDIEHISSVGKLSPKDHSEFIKELLSKRLKNYEKYLFINGAVLLLVRGVVGSIEEGYEITKDIFYSYDYSQILRNIQRYSDYLNYKNIYEL